MVTIKIYNEFIHSPIWTYGEDGVITSDFPIVENDGELKKYVKKLKNCIHLISSLILTVKLIGSTVNRKKQIKK